jgi:diaminopimelate decarboxylase
MQARYAMKACPAAKIVGEMKKSGIWIDAVSGNEVLRARRVGYPGGNDPPIICFNRRCFSRTTH